MEKNLFEPIDFLQSFSDVLSWVKTNTTYKDVWIYTVYSEMLGYLL